MSNDNRQERVTNDLIHHIKQLYGKRVRASTVVIHSGPKVGKSVSVLKVPKPGTGELYIREFRARTWKVTAPEKDADSYTFQEDQYHWHCQDEEVEILRQFLNGEFTDAGSYRLVKTADDIGELLDQAKPSDIPPEVLFKLVELARRAPQVIDALAASPDGALLAEAVELKKRREQLKQLRQLVEDPESQERRDLHPQLKQMAWIFGGRYVGDLQRNELATGDVLDIPLLRPDGSLHVVELKGANIPRLVHRHRGPNNPQTRPGLTEELPLIVGTEVHEAVGQIMNYLCHLDEERDRILAKRKIETRRATGTVLIGHPNFVSKFDHSDVASTLRIYNSHLSRVQVMHYQDLIDNAERALALAAEPLETAEDADLADDGTR